MDPTVHLALGARDGDPRAQLLRGLEGLVRNRVQVLAVSSLWETEPVDLGIGPPVLNAAAALATALTARDLLALCQRLEDASGRRRTPPEWRSLDLDILLMGSAIRRTPELVLPHPRFHLRRFNLAPLAEIAPGVRHPLLGRSVAELLEACRDRSWVRVLEKRWTGGVIERVGEVR